MPFALDDLLAYSDWDRGQWYAFFAEHGAKALAVDLGPNAGAVIKNVGELVRHIFAAELRYVQRCRREPLADASAYAADDVEALFALGKQSRAAVRDLLATFPREEWDAPREMQFGKHDVRIVSSRKMILQALTHELRHWAQVATFLRQAGFKPGPHDLIASPLFEVKAPAAAR